MLKLLFSVESIEVSIMKEIIDGLGDNLNNDAVEHMINDQNISDSEKEMLKEYATKKAA